MAISELTCRPCWPQIQRSVVSLSFSYHQLPNNDTKTYYYESLVFTIGLFLLALIISIKLYFLIYSALPLFHLVPPIFSPYLTGNSDFLPRVFSVLEVPPNLFLPIYWPFSSLLKQSESALAKIHLHSVNKYSTTFSPFCLNKKERV